MNFCFCLLYWLYVSFVIRINFVCLFKGNFFCCLNEVKVEIMLFDCCKRNYFFVFFFVGVNVNFVCGLLFLLVVDGYMLR